MRFLTLAIVLVHAARELAMRGASVVLVALLILSCVLSSSAHVSAANPTLNNYGCMPLNADAGQLGWLFFCIYFDADNDAPTTMQISRQYLTSPIYNMVANDTLDTNYVDGKAYYYMWYWLPFVGYNQMRFLYASNGSATYWRPALITQFIPPLIRNTGTYPVPDLEGNYSFFANYYSAWYYQPAYVNLLLDGVNYTMIKNDSGDIEPILWGINYSRSVNLSAGVHTYSFHTMIASYSDHDRATGNFTAHISSANTTISLDPDVSMLVLALVFGFGLIAMSYVDRKRGIWGTFAGFIWITESVVVFFDFEPRPLWFVIALGIGLILMLEGTKAYAAGRRGE